MSVEESVERMKKFLLGAFFAPQELNVIDQKEVRLPITLAKLDQITVLNRINEFVDEQLTRDVDHLHGFPFCPDELADRLHEMRLAETHASIDEQRIVRARGRLGDSETRRMRDFVVRTDHERFEGVSRIQSWNCGARARIGVGG